MKSDETTVCVLCGQWLPTGINFKQIFDPESGELIGNRCWSRCAKDPLISPGIPKKKWLKSVENIVAYLADEEKHFNECEPEGQEGHIWNDVLVLKRYLQLEKACLQKPTA